MKGRILYVDGREEFIEPKNGTDFSLEELQTIVDGYIEVVRLGENRIMVVNEEGKLQGLPFNKRATNLVVGYGINDVIVGTALVCNRDMVK